MALANAANRRIARHRANPRTIMGHQQRARPHPRRHSSGLGAGMTTADNDHVIG
jgi:hypothetical protein